VLALFVPWRPAWALFAAGALAVTLYNAWLLRGLPRPAPRSAARPVRLSAARRVGAPLFASAFSYGVLGSVYWTFAVDLIADDTTGPLFWTLIGVAGIGGLLTARTLAALGLRRTHTLLFAVLAVAIAVLAAAPGAVVAVGLSAVLYGPAFMAVSALLAVWSYQVFPDRPAAGFSAVVFCLGLGTIAGPVTLGAVAAGFGLPAAFLLTTPPRRLRGAARGRPVTFVRSQARSPRVSPPRRSPRDPLRCAHEGAGLRRDRDGRAGRGPGMPARPRRRVGRVRRPEPGWRDRPEVPRGADRRLARPDAARG
jgi:hypothetical protein